MTSGFLHNASCESHWNLEFAGVEVEILLPTHHCTMNDCLILPHMILKIYEVFFFTPGENATKYLKGN